MNLKVRMNNILFLIENSLHYLQWNKNYALINVILKYQTLIRAKYTFDSWYLDLIFFNTDKDYVNALEEDYTLSQLSSHQLRNKFYIEKCMYLKFWPNTVD